MTSVGFCETPNNIFWTSLGLSPPKRIKSEAISIKTDLKTEVKEEKFRDFEAHEQVGIDLITSKDFETPIVKSELFYMKKEVKTEVKQEPLETFEAREQGGIDFITSRNFDRSFYESEWNRLIEPCYLKLVKTDQQYQQISKIAKKIGKKRKSDHCRKRFDKKSNLKIHERSCNRNKPYSCQTCSECFKKLSNLKAHGLIHTGEKPYMCIYCSKTFRQKGDLKGHELIHTGEKPYSWGLVDFSGVLWDLIISLVEF